MSSHSHYDRKSMGGADNNDNGLSVYQESYDEPLQTSYYHSSNRIRDETLSISMTDVLPWPCRDCSCLQFTDIGRTNICVCNHPRERHAPGGAEKDGKGKGSGGGGGGMDTKAPETVGLDAGLQDEVKKMMAKMMEERLQRERMLAEGKVGVAVLMEKTTKQESTAVNFGVEGLDPRLEAMRLRERELKLSQEAMQRLADAALAANLINQTSNNLLTAEKVRADASQQSEQQAREYEKQQQMQQQQQHKDVAAQGPQNDKKQTAIDPAKRDNSFIDKLKDLIKPIQLVKVAVQTVGSVAGNCTAQTRDKINNAQTISDIGRVVDSWKPENVRGELKAALLNLKASFQAAGLDQQALAALAKAASDLADKYEGVRPNVKNVLREELQKLLEPPQPVVKPQDQPQQQQQQPQDPQQQPVPANGQSFSLVAQSYDYAPVKDAVVDPKLKPMPVPPVEPQQGGQGQGQEGHEESNEERKEREDKEAERALQAMVEAYQERLAEYERERAAAAAAAEAEREAREQAKQQSLSTC